MSDTEHSVKYHHNGRQDEGQAIHEQLTKLGISASEIETIIFTHLHWDHCFNLERFPDAKLITSRTEHEFALNPIPFYWSSYEYPEKDGLTPPFAGRSFTLTEGEAEVEDGITVLPLPGHSPGHIGVSINTAKGCYMAVGDLAFLPENFEPDKERGWPITPPGRFCNILDIWQSIMTVKRRADYILMAHDPTHIGVELLP
jgi:glyoxylase-like metal-dependent hydrolase (beta-lactamase superfamily II)